MKLLELANLAIDLEGKYGNLTVGYDSGVMTFTGDYTLEDRYGEDDKTISLEGEYN